ncbi:MAG: hypothetical protein Roseis2KO_15680 [Roseivirga sp.]
MRSLSRLIVIVVLTCAACGSDDKGALKDEILTLNLTYIAWACDCANWATFEDIKRYPHNSGDSLAYMSVFIEPASEDLVLSDTLGYTNDLIRFTGSFYEKRGFPANYTSIENPDRARVFRYTAFQVLSSNYRANQKLLEEQR